MYIFRNKKTTHFCKWGETKGDQIVHEAPLLFPTKADAHIFADTILGPRKKDWRLEQSHKFTPCWIYEKEQFHWEGTLSLPEVSTMNLMRQIQHPEGLPPELEALARQLYQKVGIYNSKTFEQWELGFLQDANPDKELAVWADIADAHHRYMVNHPAADPRTIVSLLIIASTGGDGGDATSYYHGPIKPISISHGKCEETLQLHVSPGVAAAMSTRQYHRLAAKWTDKAAHKKCKTPVTQVHTKYGDIVFIWDWENRIVRMCLKTEYNGFV